MPATMPFVEPTVATDGVILLHSPPPVFVKVVVAPVQTVKVPEIVPGKGLTFTVATLKQPELNI